MLKYMPRHAHGLTLTRNALFRQLKNCGPQLEKTDAKGVLSATEVAFEK